MIAAVPPKAVLAIFSRYGKPLAVPMPPDAADDQRALLALPDGGEANVRVLQVRGYGDVIPNDYFVLERAGEDAVAVEGPLFASARRARPRDGRRPVRLAPAVGRLEQVGQEHRGRTSAGG